MLELVYASAATVRFSVADLATLLTLARARNATNGITGALFYDAGSFLQVLEGDEAVVEQTFERIGRDPRHARVLLLSRSVSEERRFGDWQMGFVEVTPKLRASLDGFSEFLGNGQLAVGGNPVALKKILDSFREGRYRQLVR